MADTIFTPRILCYHTVSRYPFRCNAGIDTKPVLFQMQMDYLHRHYRVIPLDEIIRYYKKGINPPADAVAITFDDGYRDNFINAFPILKHYQFPATIFCVSSQLQSRFWRPLSDWKGLSVPMLTSEDMSEMSKFDISFASHCHRHRALTGLNDDEIRNEMELSREIIKEWSGQNVNLLSYPFGEFNDNVKEIASNSGYDAAFAVWTSKPSIYSICRIPIHQRDRNMLFRFKVKHYYELKPWRDKLL